MMRSIILVIFILGLTQSSKPSWAKYGPEYETLSADQKSESIWQEVIKDKKSQSWYNSVQLVGLLTESMSPSLDWVGDTFESGLFGPRSKYIHTVGNVAKIAIKPIPNKEGYTGQFQTGSQHGFIRFSAAKEPDVSKKTASAAYDNFTPGFGLKLLRDGIPSANLVAMYGVNGQPSWNFFANSFSNHIAPAEGTALGVIAKKFSSATPYIQTVGLLDFAAYHEDGTKVQNPQFPFKLIFEPTNQVNNLFSNDYTGTYFTNQLSTIPSGTTLYKVLAVKNPGDQPVQIAELSTTSELTTSQFGDKYLFFRHQDMKQDLNVKPEWKDKTPTYDCPFAAAISSWYQ